jgi:acetylornithine deacetylase/succinyl-diaminopimelate desuccinylase-like protein
MKAWNRVLAALLVASVLPLASPAGAFWPFDRRDWPDPARDPAGAAAAILSRAIQFRTVNPPGDERPLAEYLVSVLRREGVTARVIETPPGVSQVGRAAVWARVPGTGARRPIVLHSHLDVVPAEPDEWMVSPFDGVVAGGSVIGRGALDAKGITVVHLLALVELAHRAKPLDRDVILLATPDEETGGQLGSGILARERPDLLYDAEYLLTEGGGILEGPAGTNVWGVAVTEKIPCWIRVTAHGTGGHGSSEPRDAAIPRLLGVLERLVALEGPVRVGPEVERMFAALAPSAAPVDRAGYADLRRALETDPAFRARFLAERGQSALVRDTITVTVLKAGSQTNVVPSQATAQLDARLLPGERCEAFVDRLRDQVDGDDVELEPLLSLRGSSSPIDTGLYRAIERVAAETDPGAIVVPRVIAGFTDAHWYRDLGIVAYGFLPRWLSAADTRGIHGPDERVSLGNLERGVRTLVRLLEIVGGDDDAQPPGPRAR